VRIHHRPLLGAVDIKGQRRTVALVLWCVVIAACAQPSGKQQTGGITMDKETLARRVEPLGKEIAGMIREPRSTLEQRPTPFFKDGAIYIVTYPGKFDPRTLVIGTADGQVTTFLSNQPAEFIKVAKKAGVDLSTPELRTEYVKTFLETTRDFKLPFRLINKFEDLKPPNAPSPEQTAEYNRLKTKYANIIHPLKLEGAGPWQFTGFAQRGPSLVQIVGTLGKDGEIQSSDKVLETSEVIAYSH
jgi:hypothetical protein